MTEVPDRYDMGRVNGALKWFVFRAAMFAAGVRAVPGARGEALELLCACGQVGKLRRRAAIVAGALDRRIDVSVAGTLVGPVGPARIAVRG
jgi:hypothetical protein